jgi:hypothetical protein
VDPYLYKIVYLQASLVIVLLSFFVYARTNEAPGLVLGYNAAIIWSLPAVIVLFIGTRPISGAFVDMVTYAQAYEMAENRGFISFASDWAFSGMMQMMVGRFDVGVFFFICAVLYVVPLAIASNLTHRNWAGAALICMTGAFSFFAYGVNGLRQGIATSFVVLGIALWRRKLMAALVLTIAAGMHKSVLATIVAFLLASVITLPALYAIFWLTCFAISFFYGQSTSAAILGLLPIGEDVRADVYFHGQGADKGGFRADFILYSIIPVVVSYLFGDAKIKSSKFYRVLLSTYLITNAFWLLSMYAAFSNRFAYLSWCILPWVVIAPLIPNYTELGSRPGAMPSRPILVGLALCAHYAFTYFMFFVYYD